MLPGQGQEVLLAVYTKQDLLLFYSSYSTYRPIYRTQYSRATPKYAQMVVGSGAVLVKSDTDLLGLMA